MPLSMNELVGGRELILKSPRLIVSEGFYEKANKLRDAKVSLGGLNFFKKGLQKGNWILR